MGLKESRLPGHATLKSTRFIRPSVSAGLQMRCTGHTIDESRRKAVALILEAPIM
jgi:hypothetical protein